MGAMIIAVAFDFVWVQYYNIPECSARAWIEASLSGLLKTDFAFDSWSEYLKQGASKNAKLFIGLPGSNSAANTDLSYYLDSVEADALITAYSGNDNFGGVMIWDATFAEQNEDGAYHDTIKTILDGCIAGSTTTSSAVYVSTTSSVVQSTSASIETTH